ncbi:hypothetical protein BDV36DRAFT_57480 [Aspergillus pseudocaelatus]|uniref:Uncharacterized protein n=1 Tax=Aspergillus pseudocaelatus TaxID=1825620 RepID=A0ABQ6W5X3_9EURO|nr:hypothetical protein BDV36DRAFT_57480 [Aspergillus pseudocaelatus]
MSLQVCRPVYCLIYGSASSFLFPFFFLSLSSSLVNESEEMLYIQQSEAMIEASIAQMYVAFASVSQKMAFALEINLRKTKGNIETIICDIYHSPSICRKGGREGNKSN